MKSAILMLTTAILLSSCEQTQPNAGGNDSADHNATEQLPAEIDGVRVLAAYPILQSGQTTFVIPPSDARLRIQRLVVPAGVTLRPDPSIKSIEWIVDTWQIGQNATVDLTAPTQTLVKPAKSPPLPQRPYCETGSAGAPGLSGVNGLPGIAFAIKDLRTLDNDGSLWIKTDGGPGGEGGDGQNGQQGGGPRRSGFHQCRAANGGGGGAGGPGGIGGAVSNVQITFNGPPPVNVISIGTASVCGPSTRPSGATGATGVIAVYGGRGCNGKAGSRGTDGISG